MDPRADSAAPTSVTAFIDRFRQSRYFDASKVRGASASEIEALERASGHRLPRSYKQFLAFMGHADAGLFEWDAYRVEDVSRPRARNVLLETLRRDATD